MSQPFFPQQASSQGQSVRQRLESYRQLQENKPIQTREELDKKLQSRLEKVEMKKEERSNLRLAQIMARQQRITDNQKKTDKENLRTDILNK